MNLNWPISRRTNPHNLVTRKRIQKSATIVKMDFTLPTSASISIQRRARRRRMLTRPKSQCHCVRILREQRNPAISLPLPQVQPVRQRPSQRLTKKKEQKRKTKDPFSRNRTVEGKLRHAVV